MAAKGSKRSSSKTKDSRTGQGAPARDKSPGEGMTAGEHHSPSTVAGKTGAGTTESRMGSAEAVVESERSKAATRTETASPNRKSKVKEPAASGGDEAQTAKQKIKRDPIQELDDLKAELGSVLGHPFGQVRPEEPAVQEPIGT